MSHPPAAGIALATLSFLVIPLLIAPLVWHTKSRNVPAVSLILWILISNIINFINFCIWPHDPLQDGYDGSGLCDVEAKFLVGRSTALPAATLCILKGLADVMDSNNLNLAPSRSQRIRKRAVELGWCVGVPVLSMLLHLVVQPNRYIIFGETGCAPTFDESWPTIPLILLPPLIITLAAAFYASLIIYRLHRLRSAFAGMLSANGTNKARFLRLLILALVFLLVLLPTQIWVLTLNLPAVQSPYSWNRIHAPAAWRTVTFAPSTADLQDRWIALACGLLVFLALGLGQEARATYRAWMLALGLARVFPGLGTSRRTGGTDRGTAASGRFMGLSRSKLFGLPQRWSRRSSGKTWTATNSEGTLLSPVDGQHRELDFKPDNNNKTGLDVSTEEKDGKDSL